MSWLPPIPPWNAIHVVIVHIPIALLAISPLFVLLGMLPGRWQAGTRLAALVLLLIGSTAAFIAVESGEAAAEIATTTEVSGPILEHHAELGEWTRNVFAGITGAYLLFVIATLFWPRFKNPLLTVSIQLLLLAASLVGALLVANTGHLGGHLVHEFGIRAPL